MLEEQKDQLEQQILMEQIKNPVLSREQITFFLDQYKKTDIHDETQRQRLIDCFVNAVFVYDDKIVLTFNYKDGSKTVSLADVDSSDLVDNGPPNCADKKDAGKKSALMCGFFAPFYRILEIYENK